MIWKLNIGDIPIRKYLVLQKDQWNTTFLGIHKIKIEESILIQFNERFHEYEPTKLVPISDIELNSNGVYYILYVKSAIVREDFSIELNSIKKDPLYITYLRNNSIDKLIN